MFAALKRNAAKRRAARKAHNERFHTRMAAIREKEAADKAQIAKLRVMNKARFAVAIEANNRKLVEAWSK